MNSLRIGQGIDSHKIRKGPADFILGGILIESEYEIIAHSDGDIICHSIIDAFLGALNLGDLGSFAPNNKENENISSLELLKKAKVLLDSKSYKIVNIDCTYIGEVPRLEKYKSKIEKELSRILSIKDDQVSCKATTRDGLGFEGKLKGISCQSIVLLSKK